MLDLEKQPGINMAKIPARAVAGLRFAIGSLAIFFMGVPHIYGSCSVAFQPA